MALGVLACFFIVSAGAEDAVEMVQTKTSLSGQSPADDVIDTAVQRVDHRSSTGGPRVDRYTGYRPEAPSSEARVPEAVDLKKPYVFDGEQIQAGQRLRSSPNGDVAIMMMKYMDKLSRYRAKTIDKVGADPRAATDVNPDEDALKNLAKGFCHVLQSKSGYVCPDEPLDMLHALTQARCLVEEDVAAGTIDPAIFAVLVEVEDQVMEDVMTDFFTYFRKLPSLAPTESCPGEDGARDLVGGDAALTGSGSHELSARQTAAIATAEQVRLAVDKMASMTQDLLKTGLQMNAEEFKQTWRIPCQTLGCDYHSFQDVIGSLHAHAWLLVEAGTHPRVVRKHIHSMRNSVRLMKLAVANEVAPEVGLNTSSHLSLLQEYAGKTGSAVGYQRYERGLKKGAGTLDAAYAQLRGNTTMPLSRWSWCLGVSWGKVIGYALAPLPTVSIQLRLSAGGSWTDVGQLALDLWNGNPFGGANLKLQLVLGIGPNMGLPGPKAGMSAAASITVKPNAAKFGVSMGAAGAISWPSPSCPIMPIPPIKCGEAVVIGVTIICCSIDLFNPSDNTCDDAFDYCEDSWLC